MIQEAEVRILPAHPWQESFRLTVHGKFLEANHKKFWVKGVTYGTFRSDQGHEYNPRRVEADFVLMRQNHVNSIRVYTIPPRWMLDLAQTYGIRVFIGFPWEQHITFLDHALTATTIRRRLKASLQEVAGHPAVFCCSLGNEIPSTIVRWHGAKKVERFLHTLYDTAKDCNPDLLVTYVNYPSTEYLHLPFLDLYCFNVFLESKADFNAYLLRLQNLAGEKPLFLTEIGLDSRRNGLERQAKLLRSQIGSSFRKGCAGVFVYAWTDEWFRGGEEVEDWDFGLTTRDRHPKPALDAVRRKFSKVPFLSRGEWPKISVVVCSYNGSKTIDQCLRSLMQLKYNNYEVIVIDDGSTDSTASIASEYQVRLIRTPNHGLSAARNRGMQEAAGDIVAYIDDDAYADPDWLNYLAIAFRETSHTCIGGPNLPPPEDRWIAQCVARAPGGPVHVLLSDSIAEHVPGCNMAIRKDALQSIAGFDAQFRVAGDDVDLCWRLQKEGHTIGYHPGALVWHHRRNSPAAYFRQQRGYGRAEVLLAGKWPEKYNGTGHVSWAGRIYDNGSFSAGRIYSGIWGTAPFQSLYQRSEGIFSSTASLPEWILLILFLSFISLLGFFWQPLLYSVLPLTLVLMIPLLKAFRSAKKSFDAFPCSNWHRVRNVFTNTVLHLIQPVARLIGRWPIWRPRYKKFIFPFSRKVSIWSEQWQDAPARLTLLLEICKNFGAVVFHGGSTSRWDLQAIGGAFGSARLLMVTEEHGKGRQMNRFSIRPHCSSIWVVLFSSCIALGAAAAIQGAWIPAGIIIVLPMLLGGRILLECGRAMSAFVNSVQSLEKHDEQLRIS